MNFSRVLGCAAICLLAGCTTTGTVVPIGPDTYRVSAGACYGCGAESKSEEMALQLANAHCTSLGKQIKVTGVSSQTQHLSNTTVTFLCLGRGDRDLTRPNLERVPDIVIQR